MTTVMKDNQEGQQKHAHFIGSWSVAAHAACPQIIRS